MQSPSDNLERYKAYWDNPPEKVARYIGIAERLIDSRSPKLIIALQRLEIWMMESELERARSGQRLGGERVAAQLREEADERAQKARELYQSMDYIAESSRADVIARRMNMHVSTIRRYLRK
jgi:hypothetical protein